MVRRALTAGEAVRVRRTYGDLDAPWYGTVVRIVGGARCDWIAVRPDGYRLRTVLVAAPDVRRRR